MSYQDDLLATNEKIKTLTGEDFHLYTSRPGDGQTRVVFADGAVKQGYASGASYAAGKLARLLRERAEKDA